MNDININKLLLELEQEKNSMREKRKEIESYSEKLSNMFNIQFTYKNKHLIQEKIDVLTRFYEIILKYDKEIANLIKDQIQVILKQEQLNIENDENVLVSKINKLADLIKDDIKNQDIQFSEEDIFKMDEEFRKMYEQQQQKKKEAEQFINPKPTNVQEGENNIRDNLSKFDFERDFKDQNQPVIIEEKLKEEKTNKQLTEEIIECHKQQQEKKNKLNIFIDG